MIINKKNDEIISEKEIICKNIFSQAHGLMFRFKPQNLVMVFDRSKRVSLHNLFVFYPIDILILDENKKVVEIKENFRPFTLNWTSEYSGRYVIELGIRDSWGKVKVGEEVEIND